MTAKGKRSKRVSKPPKQTNAKTRQKKSSKVQAKLRKTGSERTEKSTPRQFSDKYKLKFLAKVESCPPGTVSALLRREGLHYSYLSRWRRQRDEGTLTASAAGKVAADSKAALEQVIPRLAKLEREVARLKRRQLSRPPRQPSVAEEQPSRRDLLDAIAALTKGVERIPAAISRGLATARRDVRSEMTAYQQLVDDQRAELVGATDALRVVWTQALAQTEARRKER